MKEVKVLIVEDEKKIADTLSFGLKENGYEAEVAYDGETGLNLFSSGFYNLLLVDINLPGINGIELCRHVRQKDAGTAVIMLTCLNTLSNKVEGYDAGADDYIVKPFEFGELLLRMRAILKRSMAPAFPGYNLLKAENLLMNLDSREVMRDNEFISLTSKEFQLLEYLLRNRNRVVSRAEIAINVWGIDFDTNTNVIDVYISYLRNKIDKKYSPKLVHTLVGAGYMLKSISS